MDKPRLTQEDYQKLVDGERDLMQALSWLDELEGCDVDCQELKSMVTRAIARNQKVKQHFAPVVMGQS